MKASGLALSILFIAKASQARHGGPSTLEIEAGRYLQVQGQAGLRASSRTARVT